MAFREVSSLDAEVVVALGKKDKATGKPYPKQAEGYYLGTRVVENKRGESKIHFLQTANGNLGLWGTTDLNRKLANVAIGTMVRVTSTGTKPTPNGDMYMYRVELDSDNTIEVAAEQTTTAYSDADEDVDGYVVADETTPDEDEEQTAALLAAEKAAKAAKVQEIMNRKVAKKN